MKPHGMRGHDKDGMQQVRFMDAFQLQALASSGDSVTLWLQDSSCDAPGVSITPRTVRSRGQNAALLLL